MLEKKEDLQVKVICALLVMRCFSNVNAGRFILDRELCTELVVPDLTNFKLKAYVGPGALRHFKDITN